MKTINPSHLLLIAGLAVTVQSCAPVFSELQSARTVGKNRVEITASGSSVAPSDPEDEDIKEGQNHLGVQGAYGITPKLDFRVRYEYIRLKDHTLDSTFKGINVIAFGPKISLLKDKIALSLPFGKAFGSAAEDLFDEGDGGGSWQFHPSLLVSLPAIKDKIDINIAPKYLMTLCKDCGDQLAVNFGLALSTDLNKWAIRPEYGILFYPGENFHYNQFSIGFSKSFGK